MATSCIDVAIDEADNTMPGTTVIELLETVGKILNKSASQKEVNDFFNEGYAMMALDDECIVLLDKINTQNNGTVIQLEITHNDVVTYTVDHKYINY